MSHLAEKGYNIIKQKKSGEMCIWEEQASLAYCILPNMNYIKQESQNYFIHIQ